ncbi:hypothetical protein ACCS86_37700, partial [Rhizobium ruizarguesonis]
FPEISDRYRTRHRSRAPAIPPAPGGTLDAEDMIGGHRFKWTGKWQSISLNPEVLPYTSWRISSREA